MLELKHKFNWKLKQNINIISTEVNFLIKMIYLKIFGLEMLILDCSFINAFDSKS